MDNLSGVITEICKFFLWDAVKEHGTYLLCYSRHINNLETQGRKLEGKRFEVQKDVDRALGRGEPLHSDVQRWLDDVRNVKSEAQNVTARSANAKCCNGWCWNPIVCYQLGKEAAEKILAVDELLEGGSFQNVARSPPRPPVLLNPGFRAFASTESSMNRVLHALQNDSANIIAVHGMGGVGKTTLVKQVAKKAESDRLFDKIVMVTVSQNVIIKRIQDDIGASFDLKFGDESESVRATKLFARLNQVGKSLVILDDLWNRLELSDVGIPCGDQHKKCKIVATTRSLDVCNAMDSQVNIRVDTLPEGDSWDLFQTNAGDVVNRPELSPVARNIARKCKGLPLAIVVLGRALKNRTDVSVWNDVLASLKKALPTDIYGMEKEVFNSIKFSFEYLQSELAKWCFLFCCLFPEDHIIDPIYVTHYMVGERLIDSDHTLEEAENKVHHLMENLKASGLLLEVDDNDYRKGHVKMHDVVRDVAIWISREKPYRFYSRPEAGLKEWPISTIEEDCQKISLSGNMNQVLPEEPLFPNLCTLILNHNKISVLPNRFFTGMQALRVLDLQGNPLSSLPGCMTCMTNLRVLNLSGCGLENLSGIMALKSLEILNLSWNRDMHFLSTEIGELTNLRYLNLSETRCLIPYGVISRLTRLEQLDTRDGFSDWQVARVGDTSPATIAEIAYLPHLTTLYISVSYFRDFRENLGHNAFANVLKFSIAPRAYSLTTVRQNEIYFDSSFLPDWAKELARRAGRLILEKCPGMAWLATASGGEDDNTIPSSVFSTISSLYLNKMEDLCRLCGDHGAPPDGFFGSLQKLLISNCDKLLNIFSADLLLSSSGHSPLQQLRIQSCHELLNVFEYSSASTGGGGFQTTPMPMLTRLERLFLSYLPRLTSIWEGYVPPGSLTGLEILYIGHCDSLEDAFSASLASSIKHLETLIVYHCERLHRIFPSQSVSFFNLRRLEMKHCESLATLFTWSQVQSMISLKVLDVRECDRMVVLITSEEDNSWDATVADKASVLPRLREFNLMDCPNISGFDEECIAVFDFLSLETIKIKNCPKLKKLPLRSQSAPGIKTINANKDWFGTLEWEDESIKSRLQNLLR